LVAITPLKSFECVRERAGITANKGRERNHARRLNKEFERQKQARTERMHR